MPLTGPQLDPIASTIQAAYDRDELRTVLFARLNINFDDYAPEKGYSTQLWEFLQAMNRQDRIPDVVRCLQAEKPTSAALQQLVVEFSDGTPAPTIVPPGTGTQGGGVHIGNVSAGGDVIIANVGGNASGVAIGKNIDQHIETSAPTSPVAPPPAISDPPAHHVFFAYSRQDAELVHQMRDDLLAAGIHSWVDEDDLEPGTLIWQRTIQRAIREAKCVVVVLSPEANNSEWVNSEITYARQRQVRIIPVLARGSDDDAVPLALVNAQYIDVRSDYASAVQNRLIPALQKQTGAPAVAVEPAAPARGDAESADMRPIRVVGQPPVRRTQSYYERSWALVIGIDQYTGEIAKLGNAVNDARAVGDLLEHKYGFDQVHRLYDADASQAAILDYLRDTLPSQMGRQDRLVIFFSGHGVSRKAHRDELYGYLAPQDAKAGRYASYLDMTELQRACGWMPAKHVLLILDCCFSGVAAVTARADPAQGPNILDDVYLQRITTRGAWQVLTASASDELAADSGSRLGHSAFTTALLDALGEGRADFNGDGIITATDLAAYVKPAVSRDTSRQGRAGQMPFFNYLAGSEQGDFVFVLPSEPATTGNIGSAKEPLGVRTERAEGKKKQPTVVTKQPAVVATPDAAPPVTKPLAYPQTTIAFDWVTIPAGEFLMGEDKRTVYLREYRIARAPITNAQYMEFIKATGHRTLGGWEKGRIPRRKEKHPVVRVKWDDARAFCKWANAQLPTRAQWEKAARGTDGRIYPWGNEPPTKDLCHFNKSVGDTTPVDNYPKGASPYGVMDMAGNVWEWTVDAVESNNAMNWLKGGSWLSDSDAVKASSALRYNAWIDWYDIGFRVVVVPISP